MAKVQRGGPRASRNGKKPRAHLWLKLCASVVERPRLQRDVRDHVPPKKHQHSRRITYCGEPFARLCPASLAAAPDVGRKAPVARCIATRGIAKLDAARLPIDLDWTLRLCCAGEAPLRPGAFPFSSLFFLLLRLPFFFSLLVMALSAPHVLASGAQVELSYPLLARRCADVAVVWCRRGVGACSLVLSSRAVLRLPC